MYSSHTLTKCEAVILKICPPAIITSAEVIIAEYDAILGQWEREDFYNHLSNYTNIGYSPEVKCLEQVRKIFDLLYAVNILKQNIQFLIR